MGFKFNALKGIAPIAEQMMYGYVSNDTKGQIEGAGYFNQAAGYLKVGDSIFVAGDLDGTPFFTSYVVSSNAGGVVGLTENSAVTQNLLQVLTVRVTALGTASDHYINSPIAGEIVAVYGVSNAVNGTAPSTADIKVDGATVATLSFPNPYTAGAGVSDTSISAHALSVGEVIHIDNNGEGDGAGEATITILISPA